MNVVVAFFFGFVLFTLGETEWLNRRTGSGVARSLLITLPSNVFAVVFGCVFAYWVMIIALGVVLRTSSPREVLPSWFDMVVWLGVVFVIVVPPLAIAKRLLLKVTRVDALPRPWSYGFLAALAFHVMVFVVFYLAG